MFLTHLDADGNSSPAILIDNATAANRAVNIPEFVNIPPDGLMNIDVPAAESFRLLDLGSDLAAMGQIEAAIAKWRKVLELDPRNAKAHSNLGAALMWQGNIAEGTRHLQEAHDIDPDYPDPSEAGIAIGLQFYYREQLHAAIQNSDCNGVSSYGNQILAAAPDDDEATKALADCALKQNRQQMRAALETSDWQTALSFAKKILDVQPGDDEAQKVVKECNLAISRRP
jgi:tetratricopeptide (TPR) repeat protein